MIVAERTRRQGRRALSWLAAAVGTAAASCACAQGHLEARYEASLAGIPVGKGSWTIDIADDQYSASASGGSSGLLNAFSGGSGGATAQGRLVGGALAPQNYSIITTSSRKSETVRMALAGGVIKDVSIEPAPPVDADRIAISEAHRRGVLDPMSGSLLRVAGTGDPVSPEACRGTTAIFDGRMRYDLKTEFKRLETVKSEQGYRGPVVVCAIYFEPIAGYVPSRASLKYLASQRRMEAWFAPIAGTRFLVPYRVTVPTPLGTAMLEAKHFVSTPLPRAARTQ